MVKAAQSGKGANAVSTGITDRDWPTRWRIFRQSQMGPILVVVTDILRNQPFQMPLVQDDDMIQQVSARQLPTQRSATPFCHGLRKAVRTGSLPMPFAKDTTSEFCIAVEDQEPVRWRVRPRFAHLLHDP